MSTLERFEAGADATRIVASLQAKGACIVEGLLDATLVSRINTEIDPLVEAADPAHKHLNPTLDAFFGNRVRHVTGLAGKSRSFAEEVMCHPLFLSLCDQILLPNCADYQLNLGHVMDRGPGAEAQWPHRDEDVWVHLPKPHPDVQIASIVALVDFTRENGATYVVPGSHRWQDRARQPLAEEMEYAEMPAGSAVIYLGSTIHGGGTNATRDQWRRGFHLSYVLGWLRTEENNVLAIPPHIARELSPRAQRLLGYGVHDAIEDMGGYLGMVDMQDPIELLRQGKL